MPMPKRTDVDDFFAKVEDHQRPHLEELRALSRKIAPKAREELKYNLPTYVEGEKANLWMLQNFKHHCSLRFKTEFFADHKKAVKDAGFDGGEGFIKLPYDRPLPTTLLRTLMKARLADYKATGD